MNEWLLIVGMMAVTFSSRYFPLAFFSKLHTPPLLVAALRYVPVAVLTAIIVPSVLMPYGTLDLSLHNAYLIGSLVAGGVAWRSRNLLLTIVIGLAVFFVWRALFPAL